MAWHRTSLNVACVCVIACVAVGTSPQPIGAEGGVGQYCAPVEILGSRGSGARAFGADWGVSPPGKALYDRLNKFILGVGFPWANPYNAVGVFGWNLREIANGIGAGTQTSGLGVGAYHDSVVAGKKALRQTIASLHSICPWVHLILAGYSQGAQVTGDVYQRELTAGERRMIAAVVLFGDPYFNGGDRAVDRGSFSGRRDGILGRRPRFATRGPLVLSYCHSHDPICQGLFFRIGPTRTLDPGSLSFRQHKNYTSFGEPTQAAGLIAARLRPLLPRRASAPETQAMKAAIAAQAHAPRACTDGLVSRADPHYGWIVTQQACGGSLFGDTWLRRTSTAPDAAWTIIDVQYGRIDTPSPCTSVAGVPKDLRCW